MMDTNAVYLWRVPQVSDGVRRELSNQEEGCRTFTIKT